MCWGKGDKTNETVEASIPLFLLPIIPRTLSNPTFLPSLPV